MEGQAVDPSQWASLDLREAARFKDNAARDAQEAAWASTNINARQNWAVREALQIHGARLRQTMKDLHMARVLVAGLSQVSSALWGVPSHVLVLVAEFAGRGTIVEFATTWTSEAAGFPGASERDSSILICARKRPLLPFEMEHQDWDALEVWRRGSCVVCHDGRLSRSGRKLLMTHRRFPLDRVWPDATETEEVYQDVVSPLVAAARQGGSSTMLCMGQTGTGKTYTLRGVIELLARDLAGSAVEVQFLEVYGKKCLDLLADRKEVHLRADADDRVHVRGQTIAHLDASEGLIDVLTVALGLRAAEQTERNANSSRSHAICSLQLAGGGVLRLVDLAGSERNYETTRMTAQQHRESAEINSSLMALKDCFRIYAGQKIEGAPSRMPFRASRLTQLLRDCFVDQHHRFVVVATLSPTATDVIHSVNTLRHAVMLAKPLADAAADATVELSLHTGYASALLREKPVAEWTHEDVLKWLTDAECGRFAHLVVPPDLDGRRLLGSSPQGLAALFEGTLRQARGQNEGEAWNVRSAPGGAYDEEGISGAPAATVAAETSAPHHGENLGRALFAAVRRVAVDQDRTFAAGAAAEDL